MKELAERLKESGSTFWIRACDVRNRKEIFAAVNDYYRSCGKLDVAWVNSGHGTDSSFAKWDWDRIESVLDTNLKGAIYTIRACLEIMVPRQTGAIVGIGSAAAMRGLPTRGIYSLSKIGLEYFMESLAVELPKIQFTMIHPGFVDTEINKGDPHRIWLMTPEKAAKIMIRAVERRKRILIYPWRMKVLYRTVHWLPAPVYMFFARKIVKRFSD
jgi:short-subunit dehydrogenase